MRTNICHHPRTSVGLLHIVLLGALSAGWTGVRAAEPTAPMNRIVSQDWGRTADGQPVSLVTLSNRHGMVAKITSYGAIITELHVPDRQGQVTNVVLGFDNLDRYLQGHPAFGATIGRVANRIAGARFTLDGKEYPLAANIGPHHIHGGRVGFHQRVWQTRPLPPQADRAAVEFSYLSVDGEEGYPGNLAVKVTFTLTDDNELRIDYEAETDQPTPVNLTNHSYFNLAGHGDVLGHQLEIAADRYTPSDRALIPTGEIAPVAGTPLDFTTPKAIGARIDQLRPHPNGYDHNYVLNSGGGELAFAARAVEPDSGRVLEAWTTEPGVQLFTANGLDGRIVGTGGVAYPRHAGFCLETQHFPDAINQPRFPSVVLRPGTTFRSTTVFRFSVQP
jgi:aldose 1-epimerase